MCVLNILFLVLFFSMKFIILVIVLELYCVVVLLCSILICFNVVVGMVEMLGFCVLFDKLLFRKVIIVEWWWCLLFISIRVWLEVILCKFVGWIRVEVLLIGWLLMFSEGIIVCNMDIMLVEFWLINFFFEMILIGIVELLIEWGVVCVLIIVIFLMFFVLFFFWVSVGVVIILLVVIDVVRISFSWEVSFVKFVFIMVFWFFVRLFFGWYLLCKNYWFFICKFNF